jgi:hypothetical protein
MKTTARTEPSLLKLKLRCFSATGPVSLAGAVLLLPIERTAAAAPEARVLILCEKFLRNETQPGGDQVNEPKSFERMPRTVLNKALMNFTLYLPIV